MAFCRLVSLALAAVAHTSASQYHGRVTLEEVKAYDHAGARSGRGVPKGQYNVHANPHKKAKAEPAKKKRKKRLGKRLKKRHKRKLE